MESKTVKYGNYLVNYVYEIVNPQSNFVMAGYFWGKNNVNKNNEDGLTYGQLADRLIEKCKENGCNYFIAEIPEFAQPGGYQKAINYKPTFILETLSIVQPRKVATIDTDMTVEKYPSLFDMDYDFIGFNWYYEPHQIDPYVGMECFDPYVLHTSGGMLVFANTDPSIALLREWKRITDTMPGKAEDRILGIAFNTNMMLPKMRCLWLPLSYFYIPYFYELEDYFDIGKGYQSHFKHLRFSGDSTKKPYRFDQVYKFDVNKNIYIYHPERLTSEEEAAKQGADSDRVPVEFYTETGKKMKCLNEKKGESGLINIPAIYCETSEDQKAFVNTNRLLDVLGYSQLSVHKIKDIPNIPKKLKFNIIDSVMKNDDLIVVFSNTSFVPRTFEHSYLCITRDEKANKAAIIYEIMKTTDKNVLFFENVNMSQDDFEHFMDNEYDPTVDFACINTNAQESSPYLSIYAPNCYDPRSLFTITTDLLYFANNRWGENLLKLWYHDSKKSRDEDRYSLSAVFNRYMYVIYSRVKWFSPFSFCPVTSIFSRRVKGISFDSIVTKYDRNIPLYDFFKQCVDRKPLTKGYGKLDKKQHYTTGKMKSITKTKGIKKDKSVSKKSKRKISVTKKRKA